MSAVRRGPEVNQAPPWFIRCGIALIVIGLLVALPQLVELISRSNMPTGEHAYGPMKTNVNLYAGLTILCAGFLILLVDSTVMRRKKTS